MRADLASLKCVCDEIARVIKSAESSKIAESSAIFLLNGDIGAGKTTLVKAFAKYVGIEESVTSPTFSLLHIYSASNSVLGMQFRTCEKFWESTDSGLVLSQNFSQIQKPHCNHFDCDSQSESTTNQTKSAESSADSANQTQNAESSPFCHSKSFSCHSERSEESKKNPSLRANPQDLRGNPPCDSVLFSSGGLPRLDKVKSRNDEILDSSLRKYSAQNDNNSAESALDSAESQNLTLYHYDLFNRTLDELLDLGLLDLLSESGIHFVEWGDRRLFNILKNAFENIFIIQITKAKNDRIYEFKSSF